jgi:hypothetical protein
MTTVFKPKRSVVPASIPTAGQLEVGEIAINIPDGKFYTKDASNIVKEIGGAGATTLQAVTNSGAITTNDITLNGADLIFEGNVENAFETILTVAEPTIDRIITLPNITGTVITTGDTGTVTSAMIVDGTIINADIADTTIRAAKLNLGSDTLTVGSLSSSGAVSGTTGTFSGAVSGTTGTFSNLNLTQNGVLIFEGSTNDDFETTITVSNPTADRTITLPDQSGVLATEGDSLAYAIVFGS